MGENEGYPGHTHGYLSRNEGRGKKEGDRADSDRGETSHFCLGGEKKNRDVSPYRLCLFILLAGRYCRRGTGTGTCKLMN